MTAASTLDGLRPGLGQLARALASGEDHDVVVAARALDPSALAAFLYPAEPIRVSPVRSSRRTTSIRCRQADKLTKAAADPYSNLTRWERDFIASNVPTLRSDADLSEKQAATLKRVLSKVRRRS